MKCCLGEWGNQQGKLLLEGGEAFLTRAQGIHNSKILRPRGSCSTRKECYWPADRSHHILRLGGGGTPSIAKSSPATDFPLVCSPPPPHVQGVITLVLHLSKCVAEVARGSILGLGVHTRADVIRKETMSPIHEIMFNGTFHSRLVGQKW